MSQFFYQDESLKLYQGDCREVLAACLPDCSVDALVTDPPAGIGFMSKEWDDFRRSRNSNDVERDSVFGRASARGPEYARGSRESFVEFMTAVMVECLRVLKPGAYGLVWAIPRTSHWTAWALEDAGFEIRDRIAHIAGSGFPKSLDIQRAIDTHLCQLPGRHYWLESSLPKGDKAQPDDHVCPFTPEGEPYKGYGSALKPAVEDWWLVRKPLAGTTAANTLEHGVGCLNIDECRISGPNGDGHWSGDDGSDETSRPGYEGGFTAGGEKANGRWPSHLVLSHSADCELIGTAKVKGSPTSKTFHESYAGESATGFLRGVSHSGNQHADEDGNETVEDWRCAEDCPVRLLDQQSGATGAFAPVRGTEPSSVTNKDSGVYGVFAGREVGPFYGDKGGASRFFYCSKASTEDREEGLEDLIAQARDESRKEGNSGGDNPRNRGLQLRKNHHPTVKSTELMRWLIRLITPSGGTVLDPFAGSGSTGKAAAMESCKAILIEEKRDYCEIAIRRARLRQQRLMF